MPPEASILVHGAVNESFHPIFPHLLPHPSMRTRNLIQRKNTGTHHQRHTNYQRKNSTWDRKPWVLVLFISRMSSHRTFCNDGTVFFLLVYRTWCIWRRSCTAFHTVLIIRWERCEVLENGFFEVGAEGGGGRAGRAIAVIRWSWCGDRGIVFRCHDG